MSRRHPLPRVWLVTDERQGDGLFDALERLPRGAGILLRHYSLAIGQRRALFRRLRIHARRRGQTLLLAGTRAAARAWGAHGWHGPDRGRSLHSRSVHDIRELRAAARSGATFVFVSPVFATNSHPTAQGLGIAGLRRLTRLARCPVIALGGVNAINSASLIDVGVHGWAGIDAWSAP